MTRFILCLVVGSLSTSTRASAEPSLIEHLTVFLTGTFTTADQAKGDQNFRSTALHVVSIWPNRADGPWLYFEQSLTEAEAHPHRQMVYQLATRADNALEIRFFDLIDPIAITGAWRDAARFDKLSPSNLAAREGCTLVLHLQPDGSFKGATDGKGCPSSLRGATYATTEAMIANRQITLWERGYNASGTQVWGSIHGGQVFKRLE